MMRKKLFILIAIANFGGVLGSGDAKATEYLAVTPTGVPEAHFSTDRAQTTNLLRSRCVDVRWSLVSSSDSEVICESPMSMPESVFAQVLMGNSYSTPPRRFARFSVLQDVTATRVVASGWIELQMAFGQMKRQDMAGPQFHNLMMDFLLSAGGEFPRGTRFPNHAYLGVFTEQVTEGRKTFLKVGRVDSEGPAGKAGLQSGDVLRKIAGVKITDLESLRDATKKAADRPTFDIELLRDGKEQEIVVERGFRPDATTSVVLDSPPPTDDKKTPVISVADELEKLVSLKDRGVITEAEFQQQKQKLLVP